MSEFGGGTIGMRWRVAGMHCAACAAKIEAALVRVPGVASVEVSSATGLLIVTPLEGQDAKPEIEAVVKRLGYGVVAADGAVATQATHDHHEHGAEGGVSWRSGRVRFVAVCITALALAAVVGRFVPALAWPGMIVALSIGLVPIARRAWMSASVGAPFTIEALMTIAAIGAVLIGAAEEAAVFVVLFLVGELLEGYAAGRARNSIRALTALVPKTAWLDTDGKLTEVPAETIAVGSVIVVRPGDRVAADGTILTGESGVDEAPLTGESVPKPKGRGDSVFAGTINLDAVLRVRVTSTAADNTIARVVQLVERAQEAKAPTARFIDRFAKYYTPAVLVAGAVVALMPPLVGLGDWSTWIYRGLAVLLIGCPCALVISTPAAVAAGLAAGARHGLLIKGGAVLEQLGRIDTVALDKTGTLTEGQPRVTDVIGIGRSEAEVIRLAAALESGSSHPLAKAVLHRAAESGITVPAAGSVTAIGGKGIAGTVDGEELFLGSPQAVEARGGRLSGIGGSIAALNAAGKTVAILLGRDVIGLIAMRDQPRADARAGLEALKARGIAAVMLTGDNRATAEALGRNLGIDVKAELLPQDKLAAVEALRAEGKVVAKVGDGINDAPALAAAHVGIAMGSGTDVALETADAAILHGRVLDVAHMIDLSRQTMSNIWQNMAVALGLKAVFLATTIAGVTGLWPAILADTGATVLVTLNALRLLGWDPAHPGEQGPAQGPA